MDNWGQINKEGYSRASCLYDQLYSTLADWQLQERKDFAALTQGRILDLGCGPGRDLGIFADLGLIPVGVDFSRDMLDRARPNAHLVEADIRLPLPFANSSFSGVWACSIIPCIPRREFGDWLGEVARVLTPRGILFLSARNGRIGKVTIGYLDDMETYRTHYSLQRLKAEVTNHGFQTILAEIAQHDGKDYEVLFARKKRPG